jgi:hypothetical protein
MVDDRVGTAPEAAAADEPHFLDDPEVKDAFERMLSEFSRETDRGAILVAAHTVATHLQKVLGEIAPNSWGPKRVRLHNLSALAHLASKAGFIDETTHRSIDLLRKLRNTAAHSQSAFRLSKVHDKLLELLEVLGPGTALGINHLAVKLVLKSFVSDVMAGGDDLVAKIGRNPWQTPRDVLNFLWSRPDLDVVATLDDRRPRMELALGVLLLLGLIAYRRKELAHS